MDENEYQTKLKELELEIKKTELEKRRLEISGIQRLLSTLSSPAVVAAVTAVIGLLGAVTSNYLQQKANLKLEKQKNQAQLITTAISSLGNIVE